MLTSRSSCDEATGSLASKATPNEKRQEPKMSPYNGRLKFRRQASDDVAKSADQKKNPTVLNGLAGIDDGAMPRKESVLPASKSQSSGNISNQNTPLDDFQPVPTATDELSLAAGMEKREAQDKTPGNVDFWNTPFELPQKEVPNFREKNKRQSVGAGNFMNEQNGPLKGENQVLDGSHLYTPNHANKSKRQPADDNNYWNKPDAQSHGPGQHSSQVEWPRPGPASTSNITTNKRQSNSADAASSSSSNSNNPTGYLTTLRNSGSDLNFEDPSIDSANPPHLGKRDKRAQPDFDYVPPRHGPKVGTLGPSTAKNVIINKRQANGNSSNHSPSNNGQSGYLGAIGAAAEAGAYDTAGLPRRKKFIREPRQSDSKSVAPHRNGNHVEVGPRGLGSVRNIINNREAMNDVEDPTTNPYTQATVADDQGIASAGMGGIKLKSKRGRIFEDDEGKLVVTQAKREEGSSIMRKRGKIYEDDDGKLVVS